MDDSKTSGFNIQRATAADAPTLFDLITALANYEKLMPPEPGAKIRLASDISGNNPRFQAFVAELAGKPVGYGLGFETYSTFAAAPKYYVEDIFVIPEHRGKGCGRALLAALAAEAELRGCRVMEWTALDWNKTAHDFYTGLGAVRLAEWQVFRLGRAGITKLLNSI